MRRWRYRPLQAAAVVALAALMTACAAFAPLYYRAMQQALTEITIDNAPVLDSSVLISVTPSDEFSSAPVLPPEVVANKLPAEVRSDFHEPILSYSGRAEVLPGERTDPVGELVWRSDQCDHLEFTAGACPTATGEIAVSPADVDIFGFDVGETVHVPGAAQPDGRAPVLDLKVVGVYRQVPSDYWFGQSITGRSGVVSLDPPQVIQHDVWLTPRETFESDGTRPDARSSSAGFLIDQVAVGVDQLLELGPVIDDLAHAEPELGVTPANVVSGLPGLADDVQGQIDQSRVTVPLLMAQLCLLAVVVLWLVLLAITEQRRPEVALARLRGRGRRGARWLLLAELLPITLLALVPGAVLAVLANWFARRVLLPGSVPFELGWPFLAALVLAGIVLAGVTAMAVSRVAREPVERLLRRVPPRTSGWALGATEAVIIAGAGGIVVVFATGGLDGPIALAAPGLLAIVVGLVLAHLTTPTAALLGRRRLRRGTVRAGVSLLDAARSPATRRIIAIVTLASALAVFSADALVVGGRNRVTAAQQEAGAARVVEVRGNELAELRAAIDEVDPDGKQLTPVVRVLPPGEQAIGTLAVVASSFRDIALFPGGTASEAVWGKLTPPDVEPIDLVADELSLDVDDSTLVSHRTDGESHPVTIGLDLVNRRGETLHTTFGVLPEGPADHRRFTQRVSCTEGCHVTGVWASTLPSASLEGAVTLRNLTQRPSGEVVPLGPADEWTPYDVREDGTVTPSSNTPDDLTVTFDGRGATPMTMQQRWLPTIVPALVAGPLPPSAVGNRFQLAGLDGELQQAAQVGTLPRVPASPANTFVADLDSLQRGHSVLATDQLEIWFADDDPALLDRVRTALDEQGLAISSTTTLADVRRGYDASAAAWSLQLAAVVGGVALLIALLVLVVSAVSGWRFRTRDFAALRMSGVPRASIRAMAVAAQLPAVLVGVVAGGISGVVGAQLAMPIVPLFATAPEVSTLDLDTAWWAVLVAVLAALAVLGTGSVLIGRALAARSELRRLRETL